MPAKHLILLLTLWATLFPGTLFAAKTLDTLIVDEDTYTNVTVIDVSSGSVYIQHTRGIANFKVSALSPDDFQKLYDFLPEKMAQRLKQQPTAITLPPENKPTAKPDQPRQPPPPPPTKSFSLGLENLKEHGSVWGIIAAILASHLLFSFSLHRICSFTKVDAGFMSWVPFFQFIPLNNAAGLSGWFILTYFFYIIPVRSPETSLPWLNATAMAFPALITVVAVSFTLTKLCLAMEKTISAISVPVVTIGTLVLGFWTKKPGVALIWPGYLWLVIVYLGFTTFLEKKTVTADSVVQTPSNTSPQKT